MLKKLISQLKYIKSWKNAWRLLTCEIRSMELAVTYLCNQHCFGCYCADLRDTTTMSLKQAKKIIDKYNPAAINMTGGCPLLNKNIYKIIKYASDKGIIVSLVTNGSLLTLEKAFKLKEAGLNTLQISYGKNYPENNLNKAILYKTYFNVCLSVTNTFTNKEWILRAIDCAKNNKEIQILYNIPMGELEKEFDKETYFKYRNESFIREDNMYWNYNPLELLFIKNKGRCPAGTKKIYVTAKGELMPCDRLHTIYKDYKTMKEDFKDNKLWCKRLGDIDKQ